MPVMKASKPTTVVAKSKRGSKKKTGLSGLTTVRLGLPDRFHVTHTYGANFQLAPAAGNWARQTMRGNSVYDPDFTGVGTTAFAFTQVSALYYRYRVLASKLTVDFMNTGNVPLVVSIQATIANSPPVSANLIGARHMNERVIAPGGMASWKQVASARTAKIFGVPEAQVLSEDDFTGLVSSNPNNVWYWHLVATNNFGAVAGSCVVNVRLEYETLWSMPFDLAP